MKKPQLDNGTQQYRVHASDVVASVHGMLVRCIEAHTDMYRITRVIKAIEGMDEHQAKIRLGGILCARHGLEVQRFRNCTCVTEQNLPSLLQLLRESPRRTHALESLGILPGSRSVIQDIFDSEGNRQKIVLDSDGEPVIIDVRQPIDVADVCTGGRDVSEALCCPGHSGIHTPSGQGTMCDGKDRSEGPAHPFANGRGNDEDKQQRS